MTASLRGHEHFTQLLYDWLPRQRWFAGRGRQLTAVRVTEATVLRAGHPALHHAVAEVATDAGPAERYQLVVGVRSEVPQRLDYALIGHLEDGAVYEAAHDPELMARLLELIAADESVDGLRFSREGDAQIDTREPSRLSTAEQTNTSLIFGSAYMLKLFRRIGLGVNRDLEIHRALAAVHCAHIARPYGAVEGMLDDRPVTYAMLQEFVTNAAEGWQMATASVRDLYAEGDLHADEVGGDFAAEAHRLGRATAQVHADLVRAFGASSAPAERTGELAGEMRRQLTQAMGDIPQLEPYAPGLRTAFDELAGLTEPIAVHPIHGDLHLGQTLRSTTGWILIDFEGEPARPLAERTAPSSPLRDVAGMLRSFDYAARHLLADHPGDAQLEYRANEWAERNRESFCDGYAEFSGDDPRKHATLLRAFELDKAVYEVIYESRHRPSWLPIPLASIARLVGRPAA